MQFKDAAYEVLKQVGKPLHYNIITDKALASGILETSGKTPHASMGALLYTDTLNPDSRFRRGAEKGTFALKVAPPADIQQQIETLNSNIRKDLRKHLLKISPQKFEELIRQLLVQMGFEEAETTAYSNDKGIDVRGVLRSNALSTVKIAIQAKRWTANVGAGVVRDLRGSLHVADSEQGLIITPSNFTPEAKNDAQASCKTPITLINGEQLVDLLIRLSENCSSFITSYSDSAIPWTNNGIEQAIECMKMRASTVRRNKTWPGMRTGLILAVTK